MVLYTTVRTLYQNSSLIIFLNFFVSARLDAGWNTSAWVSTPLRISQYASVQGNMRLAPTWSWVSHRFPPGMIRYGRPCLKPSFHFSLCQEKSYLPTEQALHQNMSTKHLKLKKNTAHISWLFILVKNITGAHFQQEPTLCTKGQVKNQPGDGADSSHTTKESEGQETESLILLCLFKQLFLRFVF